MRTTLALDDDAIKSIQAYARTRGISLGRAASELIRRGANYQLAIREQNGLPVFEVPNDFPSIATEGVRELLNEE